MAVNKNFVVKNGLEVNTNLLVADLDTQTVGIGTTISPHEPACCWWYWCNEFKCHW